MAIIGMKYYAKGFSLSQTLTQQYYVFCISFHSFHNMTLSIVFLIAMKLVELYIFPSETINVKT